MVYDFDQVIDRKNSDSIKWNCFDPDVLPLWVADMDFVSPECVTQALLERIQHGIFGYAVDNQLLKETIAGRMYSRYGWRVSPDSVVLLPGVITGFNLACQAIGTPGERVLVQTPIYPPILHAAGYAGMERQDMDFVIGETGASEVDLDQFQTCAAYQARIFILCNPHNPNGRVFSRDELEKMAEVCLRNRVIICADEIHSDLIYTGHVHIPIASLDPEVEASSITLIAPSKTYNIAGLECSAAIIPNPELRKQFEQARRGLVHSPNLLGQAAAVAAYRNGEEWLEQLLVYLEGNRDYLYEYIRTKMPQVRMEKPEGTYLAWLDCREMKPGNPHQFFLDHARVGLNDGNTFGNGGAGFVRLNFGCSRALLQKALERMKKAYDRKEEISSG